MPDKDYIIDFISQYSGPQIVGFLKNNIVTIPEILDLNPEEYDHRKRKEVEDLLWDNVTQDNSEDLARLYLLNYPEGNHVDEANDILNGNLPPEEPEYYAPPPLPEDEPEPEPYSYEEPEPEPEPEDTVDPWESVDKSDTEALQQFISQHPDNPNCRKARILLNNLLKSENQPKGPEWLKQELLRSVNNPEVRAEIVINAFDNGRITTSEFINLFREDNNFLNLPVIEILVEQGIISGHELAQAGIPEDFISVVMNHNANLIDVQVNTNHMVNPESIKQVCQEIYFWGMPSSGKTCALGAILSAASTGRVAKTIEKNPECKGYDYMRQLCEVFQPSRISKLPPGTNANFVSDMSFWLFDNKDKAHSITLIDLAGEMLYAMYMVDQGRYEELNPDQQAGYICMRNILVDNVSKNSKIHFFVLEYGGHERKEKGIKQADLLDGALTHIIELGILKRTDAVYLLVTKADKALNEPGDVNDVIEEYIRTHYMAFYNRLIQNTKRINGGHIEMIPFTIGEVCFGDLCRFDDFTANEVVNMFLETTVGERRGRTGYLTQKLRK